MRERIQRSPRRVKTGLRVHSLNVEARDKRKNATGFGCLDFSGEWRRWIVTFDPFSTCSDLPVFAPSRELSRGVVLFGAISDRRMHAWCFSSAVVAAWTKAPRALLPIRSSVVSTCLVVAAS